MASKSKNKKRKIDNENESSDMSDSESDDLHKPAWTNRMSKLRTGNNPTPSVVPKDTSSWTFDDLYRLNIIWDHTIMSSSSGLLDIVPDLAHPMSIELTEVATYIDEKLSFDLSLDQLEDTKDRQQFKDAFQTLNNLQKSLQTSLNEGTVKYPTVHVYGIELLRALKDLMIDLSSVKDSGESKFTMIMESFCKMCNMFGSHGVNKRNALIEGTEVISIPDLSFELQKFEFPKYGHRDVITSLCATEVKNKEYDAPLLQGEKQKTRMRSRSRSGSETRLKEKSCWTSEEDAQFCPLDIKGSAHHGGQLLLEARYSVFLGYSLGLMFCKTKVMMTCLDLNTNYLRNLSERLEHNDRASLHYTDMYDIMKAEDRMEVVKALLRLGYHQNLQSRS